MLTRLLPAGLVGLAGLLLVACSPLPIDDSHRSRSHSSRVQYIVLHYTATGLEHSLQLLSQGEVSAHYLIDRDPARIYRLVDEDRRAWHAGVSSWQGRTWLNASSIGIELVNDGFRDQPDGRHWQPYSEAQIDALVALLKDLVKRHQLPPDSIIGHADIAPGRKVDPGPLFPWQRLAEAGLIRWPDAQQVSRRQAVYSQQLPDAHWFQQQLQQLGYALDASGHFDEPTRAALAALQMKYHPARHDGQADAESAAILATLNETP